MRTRNGRPHLIFNLLHFGHVRILFHESRELKFCFQFLADQFHVSFYMTPSVWSKKTPTWKRFIHPRLISSLVAIPIRKNASCHTRKLSIPIKHKEVGSRQLRKAKRLGMDEM